MKENAYGLKWNRSIDPEKAELLCGENFPILKEIPELTLTAQDTEPTQPNLLSDWFGEVSTPTHHLIEGDNLHSLACLCYTHRGQVNIIYIDPPYNTGNRDFMYNDRWIDSEHKDRKSIWLSFMEKRLRLAKILLTEDGVIFISIDDNMFAELKLLCDEIFHGNVEVMVWEKTGHGKKGGVGKASAGNTFRSEHEYIIVCYKNMQDIKYNKVFELPDFKNKYPNPDNDVRGPYKAGNISASQATQNPNSPKYYTVESPIGKKFTRQWLITKEEFVAMEKDNRIYWGKKGDAVPRIKIFIGEEREVVTGSLIKNKGSLTYGKDELEEILGIRLDTFTPKPTILIKHLIKIIEKNKESIILDFFAGSGTTGHAVLDLNKEDGGSRQFMLCTNNENNIMTDVCYPRIKKVMCGYKKPNGEKVEGLGGSLKFFKVDKPERGD